MNELQERNQQIDELLNEIIVSDDPAASAEKAHAVYQLVSGEHLSDSVKASLGAFHRAAEEERLQNESHLMQLERRRQTFLAIAAVCAVLYLPAWLLIAKLSSPLTISAIAVLAGGFVAAIYERRLVDLEKKLLRQRLHMTDLMAENLHGQATDVIESSKLRKELFPDAAKEKS